MEHVRDEAGGLTKHATRHHVILGGQYADTPAQLKMSKWRGHGAYNGCGHCGLLGQPGPSGRGMYFRGYEEKRAAGEELQSL